MQKKIDPVAVLISDVHFSLKTLEAAKASMVKAIQESNSLKVPLIIAGDLHDTKANLRGECVNALIELFDDCRQNVFILRGNHDSINEKSKENALSFLNNREIYDDSGDVVSYISVINHPIFTNEIAVNRMSLQLIPYFHDKEELRAHLKTIDAGSCIIMHQGLNGSAAGEYFNDQSALEKEDVANFRVISGHYHARQDIKTGRPQKGHVGLWSYIGNPYSLNFAEAGDPEKGFQILYDDGSLEFVPTNLRKHVKIDISVGSKATVYDGKVPNNDDIVWVRLSAPSDILTKYTKDVVRTVLGNKPEHFRLELIPTDYVTSDQRPEKLDFDSVIDGNASIDAERKARLKTLWKGLVTHED